MALILLPTSSSSLTTHPHFILFHPSPPPQLHASLADLSAVLRVSNNISAATAAVMLTEEYWRLVATNAIPEIHARRKVLIVAASKGAGPASSSASSSSSSSSGGGDGTLPSYRDLVKQHIFASGPSKPLPPTRKARASSKLCWTFTLPGFIGGVSDGDDVDNRESKEADEGAGAPVTFSAFPRVHRSGKLRFDIPNDKVGVFRSLARAASMSNAGVFRQDLTLPLHIAIVDPTDGALCRAHLDRRRASHIGAGPAWEGLEEQPEWGCGEELVHDVREGVVLWGGAPAGPSKECAVVHGYVHSKWVEWPLEGAQGRSIDRSIGWLLHATTEKGRTSGGYGGYSDDEYGDNPDVHYELTLELKFLDKSGSGPAFEVIQNENYSGPATAVLSLSSRRVKDEPAWYCNEDGLSHEEWAECPFRPQDMTAWFRSQVFVSTGQPQQPLYVDQIGDIAPESAAHM